MKTKMELRRSPTLEIGEKIKAAKSENKKLLSLSTPSLPNYIGELKTDKSWGKLTPAAGLPELFQPQSCDISGCKSRFIYNFKVYYKLAR